VAVRTGIWTSPWTVRFSQNRSPAARKRCLEIGRQAGDEGALGFARRNFPGHDVEDDEAIVRRAVAKMGVGDPAARTPFLGPAGRCGATTGTVDDAKMA